MENSDNDSTCDELKEDPRGGLVTAPGLLEALCECQLLTLGRAAALGKSAPPWEALWTE